MHGLRGSRVPPAHPPELSELTGAMEPDFDEAFSPGGVQGQGTLGSSSQPLSWGGTPQG